MVMALAVFLLLATAAQARPEQNLASLQARAVVAREEIAQLDDEASAAVERYNAARAELDAANARLIAIRRELSRAENDRDLARRTLDDRLSGIYKCDELGLLDVVFAAADFADLATELQNLELVHGADLAAATRLTGVTEQIARLAATLEEERTAALSREVELRDRQADVDDQLARRRALLDDLSAEIKRVVERQERREAEAARRLARRAGTDMDSINGTAAQRALLRETMKHLGIPYVWGGASPSQGFDCSGLVMYVYRQFGVDLLHGATLQARSGTPVPLNLMEPADLVFFGNASFYRHVGIYLGDGLFIEAPRTGDVVKISRLAGRGCSLACRYPISAR